MNNSKWPGQSFVTWLAVAYLLFVVYGSIVPFDYQPTLAAERLLLFFDRSQFDWDRQSRADVVTNILLTMPMTFLWCAVITSGGRRRPVAAPFFVLIGSAGVSFFVEWLQIFFPPRDPSLVDVIAQIFGAGLSIVLWSAWGRQFVTWLAGFRLLTTVPSLAIRLLILYGAALLAYGLFPLDLTLSVSDVYRKWRDGRVLLLPFVEWRHINALIVYGFLADIALWVPVGIFARLSIARSVGFIVLATMLAAGVLESLQLFVMSRTSDATQVIAAGVGAAIGAILSRRFASVRATEVSTKPIYGSGRIAPLAATLGWFALICAIFWYPYNFQIAPEARLAREMFSGVPLETMFYQTELRAVTEMLRKMLFFAPLGALMALTLARYCKYSPRFPRTPVAVPALFATAALVEYGKFFLPGKYPGGTNVIMEFLGGIAGYWAAGLWAGWRLRLASPAATPNPTQFGYSPLMPDVHPVRPMAEVKTASPSIKVACAVFVLGTFLWILTKLPQVPYNFRNLPHPSYPYFSMLFVAAALAWSAGFPAWIARRLATDRRAMGRYPLWIALYGVVGWILTFVAVEPIRAYKLVGSPILHWPWHFEWLLRFTALMAGIGAFAVLGCIVGGDRRYLGQRLALWLLHAVWLLPLVYWAVIVEAATDNIVELLAWNASPGAALLAALVIVTIFFAAARVHVFFSAGSTQQRASALILVALSFPLGYWLLNLATDPVIVKYGKVFSGMQFILSADREHYAQGGALFIRYLMFHLSFLLAAAMGRWLFLDGTPKGASRG